MVALGRADAHHGLLLPGYERWHEAGCRRCKDSTSDHPEAEWTKDLYHYFWNTKEICHGAPSGKHAVHQDHIGCPVLHSWRLLLVFWVISHVSMHHGVLWLQQLIAKALNMLLDSDVAS